MGAGDRAIERDVAVRFGIGLEGGAPPGVGAGAARIVETLERCGVCLVTGASGSGKSCVVRAVIERLGARAVVEGVVARGERSVVARVVGCVGCGGVEAGLRVLASAGLADARVAIRACGLLSEGERARARLAVGMARAERLIARGVRAVLIVDEFGSLLDRETARGVAWTARRWAARVGCGLVVATAHADMEGFVGAGVVARCDGGRVSVERGAGCARRLRVAIGEGSVEDYDALAGHHYRGGRPAICRRVLVARVGGRVVGVLVVSPPTRNGRWRGFAWPGRYEGVTAEAKRAAVARLNREVCCISRVVVLPAYRGMGVARRLVRAYLDDPLTEGTEAVASMGSASPFFERAGMVAYRLGPRRCDERLCDALAERGFVVGDLVDPARCARVVGDGLLRRELLTWGRDCRSTLPGWARVDDVGVLARAAGLRVGGGVVAYAHARGG